VFDNVCKSKKSDVFAVRASSTGKTEKEKIILNKDIDSIHNDYQITDGQTIHFAGRQ
jgi:hypothetical protein